MFNKISQFLNNFQKSSSKKIDCNCHCHEEKSENFTVRLLKNLI